MKKILLIGLVFILSVGLIGCGEDDNGNGDDSSVVWEEYSNDLMAISYPEQWEYEEDDYGGVMFFEEGEKTEELDYRVSIFAYDNDETEEEFWEEIEKYIEEIKSEARESGYLDFISDNEISIDDQEAIEVVFKENMLFGKSDMINSRFSELSQDLENDNFENYAEKIENYKADSTQEFIDNTTLEDLEELKELLLEIKDNVDNLDYNYIDNMIENINGVLDEGALEKWRKIKEVGTFHNGYAIGLGYINIEENYDNKIGIVNHMIDSIKLLD